MKYLNKKNLLLSLTVIVGFLSMYNATGPAANGNGDRTGSPFAFAGAPTCSSAGACHNVAPGTFVPTITIELITGTNTVVTSYIPGNAYTLRITAASPGTNGNTRYGYQMVSVRAATLANIGLWGIMPVGFHTFTVNSRIYVEHSTPSATSNALIPWIAPAAGTGPVNFYAAVNIVNNDATSSGDNSTTGNISIAEQLPCTTPITITPATTAPTCADGTDATINITVAGGTPPYTFAWTGPGPFTATTQNLTGIAPGTYNVTVTGGACTGTASITVGNTPSIIVTGGSNYNAPDCEGGTLTFGGNAIGGRGGYTYVWTGPNGYSSTGSTASIPLVPIADSGVYTLTATDIGGCTGSVTTHVGITPGVILSAVPTNPTCFGNNNGNINTTVAGSATGPITYSWTGPGGFTGNTQSLANLAAGTYILTATPASGCTQTLSVNLASPVALTVNTSTATTPVCQGTTLVLNSTATGGSGTLTYRWTGPSYSSFSQNPVVSAAVPYTAAGTYTLAVTDAANCVATSVLNVVVDTVPVVTTTPTGTLCNGSATGAIATTATGGMPFNYAYTGPNGYTAATQNVANLLAGTYSVTVTSIAGCRTTKTAVVTQPATAVTGTATSNSPICNNGTLNLFGTGSGGTGAISYSWTGPNGYTSTSQFPTIASATAVNAGVYTLTVHDANGCTFVTTTNVVLSVQPVVTTSVNNPSCFGTNNGSITTTVFGGAPPFSYAWTGPNGYTSNLQNPTSLAPGIYSVTVSGVCPGSGSTTTALAQPIAIFDSIYANNPVCAGTLLNLNSAVSGGTGNFDYSWTGPNNFVSISPTPSILSVTTAASGLYTLVVRDANNCVKAANYTVTVDTAAIIALKDTSYCPGSTVTLNAGNNGAAFIWNTGATTQTIQAGTTGTYSVIVTNAYGCPSSKSVQVSANTKPSVDSISAVVVPTNPGGYTFTAINPTAVTTYVWDFGDGTTYNNVSPTHYYTATGTYNVRLFAVNICGVDTISRAVTVTAVTAVPNVANANGVINVYPNPTRDYTIIENNSGIALTNVKVINMLGAKVYESKVNNQQSFKLNTNTFTPGIYTLYIETSAGTAVRKLEIMK